MNGKLLLAWIGGLSILLLLPPLVFQLIFIQSNVGKVPIASPTVCNGFYGVSLPFGLVSRIYEGDCLNEVEFNVEKIATAKDFSQILQNISNVLYYEVCFETTTSLENNKNIPEGEESDTIILEKKNKFRREIRFEDSIENGFMIKANKCATIPDWATGRMVIDPDFHTHSNIDEKLFNKLMNKKYLIELEGKENLFGNDFFFETTEIYAKPRHILKFIYMGLVLTWLVTVTTLVTLVLQLRKLLNGKEQ